MANDIWSGDVRTLYELDPAAIAARTEARDVWAAFRSRLLPMVLIEEHPHRTAHSHRFMAATMTALSNGNRFLFRPVLVYPRNTKLGSACLFIYAARSATEKDADGWHLVEILELNDTEILVGA